MNFPFSHSIPTLLITPSVKFCAYDCQRTGSITFVAIRSLGTNGILKISALNCQNLGVYLLIGTQFIKGFKTELINRRSNSKKCMKGHGILRLDSNFLRSGDLNVIQNNTRHKKGSDNGKNPSRPAVNNCVRLDLHHQHKTVAGQHKDQENGQKKDSESDRIRYVLGEK